MSAREELTECLKARSYDSGWDEQRDMDYCDELIDAFAHELAEKQRAARVNWESPVFSGGPAALDAVDTNVIDLIDPEVNK